MDFNDIDTEKYEACWFEIRQDGKRTITRDRENFLRKGESLSRLHDITLYKIEKTTTGLKKVRVFTVM